MHENSNIQGKSVARKIVRPSLSYLNEPNLICAFFNNQMERNENKDRNLRYPKLTFMQTFEDFNVMNETYRK